jgi:scyllo-inositol 2-dehydrogenase (NADP+)
MDGGRIGAGLAGFGLAGRYFHAPFLRAAGIDLRAVVTSRASDVASDAPGAEIVASFDALIARKDITLVIIATPNALHYAQAKAALEAGKHVVIDKPVTPTAGEARELAQLATSSGVVAAAYHNRRWDSDYLTLKSLLDGSYGHTAPLHDELELSPPAIAQRLARAPRTGERYALRSRPALD